MGKKPISGTQMAILERSTSPIILDVLFGRGMRGREGEGELQFCEKNFNHKFKP